MMNRWIGIGRLTKDVETRTVETRDGDLTISRYTLAIDRKGKKDETDFISCVCFGKTAEFAEKYLSKGMKIAVEGRIQTGSYEKDGRKIYTTDIVVENHEFCERKSDSAPVRSEAEEADDFMNSVNIDDVRAEMPWGKGRK